MQQRFREPLLAHTQDGRIRSIGDRLEARHTRGTALGERAEEPTNKVTPAGPQGNNGTGEIDMNRFKRQSGGHASPPLPHLW